MIENKQDTYERQLPNVLEVNQKPLLALEELFNNCFILLHEF